MNRSLLVFLAIVLGGLVMVLLVLGFNLIPWALQKNSSSGSPATEGWDIRTSNLVSALTGGFLNRIVAIDLHTYALIPLALTLIIALEDV